MSEFTSWLASIWSLFVEVEVPGLGISFAALWLGCFVVCLGIVILRPLLGIGGSTIRAITGVGKRAISNRRRHFKEGSE